LCLQLTGRADVVCFDTARDQFVLCEIVTTGAKDLHTQASSIWTEIQLELYVALLQTRLSKCYKKQIKIDRSLVLAISTKDYSYCLAEFKRHTYPNHTYVDPLNYIDRYQCHFNSKKALVEDIKKKLLSFCCTPNLHQNVTQYLSEDLNPFLKQKLIENHDRKIGEISKDFKNLSVKK